MPSAQGLDDPQVFAAFYDAHVAFVWRNLRRLGIASSELEDVCQEVFVTVHRRWQTFEARAQTRSWLYGIVRRVASRHRRGCDRRQRRHEAFVARPRYETGETAVASRVLAVRLQQFLDGLDQPKRDVFVLAELEEMSAREISAEVGVGANTVYSRLRAARAAFEARFGPLPRQRDGMRAAHASDAPSEPQRHRVWLGLAGLKWATPAAATPMLQTSSTVAASGTSSSSLIAAVGSFVAAVAAGVVVTFSATAPKDAGAEPIAPVAVGTPNAGDRRPAAPPDQHAAGAVSEAAAEGSRGSNEVARAAVREGDRSRGHRTPRRASPSAAVPLPTAATDTPTPSDAGAASGPAASPREPDAAGPSEGDEPDRPRPAAKAKGSEAGPLGQDPDAVVPVASPLPDAPNADAALARLHPAGSGDLVSKSTPPTQGDRATSSPARPSRGNRAVSTPARPAPAAARLPKATVPKPAAAKQPSTEPTTHTDRSTRGLLRNEEITLLRSARAAIDAGKPRKALAQLREHARRFRTSPLATERDASAAEAYCATGRSRAAAPHIRRLQRAGRDALARAILLRCQ